MCKQMHGYFIIGIICHCQPSALTQLWNPTLEKLPQSTSGTKSLRSVSLGNIFWRRFECKEFIEEDPRVPCLWGSLRSRCGQNVKLHFSHNKGLSCHTENLWSWDDPSSKQRAWAFIFIVCGLPMGRRYDLCEKNLWLRAIPRGT